MEADHILLIGVGSNIFDKLFPKIGFELLGGEIQQIFDTSSQNKKKNTNNNLFLMKRVFFNVMSKFFNYTHLFFYFSDFLLLKCMQHDGVSRHRTRKDASYEEDPLNTRPGASNSNCSEGQIRTCKIPEGHSSE